MRRGLRDSPWSSTGSIKAEGCSKSQDLSATKRGHSTKVALERRRILRKEARGILKCKIEIVGSCSGMLTLNVTEDVVIVVVIWTTIEGIAFLMTRRPHRRLRVERISISLSMDEGRFFFNIDGSGEGW